MSLVMLSLQYQWILLNACTYFNVRIEHAGPSNNLSILSLFFHTLFYSYIYYSVIFHTLFHSYIYYSVFFHMLFHSYIYLNQGQGLSRPCAIQGSLNNLASSRQVNRVTTSLPDNIKLFTKVAVPYITSGDELIK